MASEAYANDFETRLNGGIVTAVRPVTFNIFDPVPAVLNGGNFRLRIDGEFMLITTVAGGGTQLTGSNVEGSAATTHANNAVVDQVLTRQGLFNSPGPMTAQGDLAYLDSTLNPARLALGTNGQVLTADGATGIPKWAAASGGGGGGGGASVTSKAGGMYRNSSLALTNDSAFHKIPFDTVLPNMDNTNVVIASSRYVADVAGVYHFDGAIRFDATINHGLAFFINGGSTTTSIESYDGIRNSAGDEISLTVYLNAGDYIELFYVITAGANIDQTNYPKFATRMVGYRVDQLGVSVASSNVAKMYRNAAIANLTGGSVWTKFPFDTVKYDPNAQLTIGSSRFTPGVAGKYRVAALIGKNDTTSNIYLAIYKNGAQDQYLGSAINPEYVSGSADIDLLATDFIEIFYKTNGTPAGIVGEFQAYCTISLVPATGAGIIVPQGPITIPGFAGSPDIQASGASDDEFEVTSTALPVTGWTTGTQAPAAGNVNKGASPGAKSHLYLKSTAANDTLAHIYKAAPATPYTMIAKLADHTVFKDTAAPHCGIFVADAGPPVKAVVTQLLAVEAAGAAAMGGGLVTAASYTSIGAAPATGATDISTRKVPWAGGALYFKMVVVSVTDISIYCSFNGVLWIPIKLNYANAVALANVGQVGIYVDNANNGPGLLEALFDFIRFS